MLTYYLSASNKTNLYPTPFTVLKWSSPIFSLNFLMCTSMVLPPTTTSFPQTVSKITSLLNTLPGFDVKRESSSNSFLGSVIFLPAL